MQVTFDIFQVDNHNVAFFLDYFLQPRSLTHVRKFPLHNLRCCLKIQKVVGVPRCTVWSLVHVHGFFLSQKDVEKFSSELIIAIAAYAPVYSVYNMRSCCSAFRLQYNAAFGNVRKEMYDRYFSSESSIDVFLSSSTLISRRVQALLFGAYLAMVRKENDMSFSFFACNGSARCVSELFLLPYAAASMSMQTLKRIGLTLIAVHTRNNQDLGFVCIKDAFHDGYVSSVGWKTKKQKQLLLCYDDERASLDMCLRHPGLRNELFEVFNRFRERV